MRRIKFLAIAVFGFSLAFTACSKKNFEGAFSYEPTKPKQGDEIEILYNSDKTKLAGSNTVKASVYFYKEGMPSLKRVELTRVGDIWSGKVTIPDTSYGAVLKFSNDVAEDNNSNKGYAILLYGDEGNIVPGAKAGLGEAYSLWGRNLLEMETNRDTSIYLMEEEFQANPSIKIDFLSVYLANLDRAKGEEGKEKIKSELEALEQKEQHSVEELTILENWYRRLEMEEKSEQYASELREISPKGEFVQREKYNEIRNEKEVNVLIRKAKEFKRDFKKSDFETGINYTVLRTLIDSKDFETLKKNYDDFFEGFDGYYYDYFARNILTNDGPADLALAFINKGLTTNKKKLESPEEEKPKYLTLEDWKENMVDEQATLYDAQGMAFQSKGEKLKALESFSKAFELNEGENFEINERFAVILSEAASTKEAFIKLELMAQKGKASPKVKELFKEVYRKEKGSLEGFESLMAGYSKEADSELKAELKKQILNSEAPMFTLTDLNGQEVSLSDYKNKVVIVDFWATWCGPCLRSFPGMQQAVEKYDGNEYVKFLFVNTWERVDDKKKNAKEFIEKNNYSFHVLMDEENEVVQKFKVDGIPTKFIIGADGKIKFKSVGFAGSTEEMVKELSAMIELSMNDQMAASL